MESPVSYAEQFGATDEDEATVDKVLIICSKGTLEDVYASLVMANGAVMDGIETHLFFTFYGLDAITKGKQDKLHAPTVGNPSLMKYLPTLVGAIPGFEALVSWMMKSQMEDLDVPRVSEFLDMIVAGGGRIHACQLGVEMFELEREDMVDDLEDVITVGEMLSLASGERAQTFFV